MPDLKKTAITHTYIWQGNNEELAQLKDAQDPVLVLFQGYKGLLTSNNTCYNLPVTNDLDLLKGTKELIEKFKEEKDEEKLAVTYNLCGMISANFLKDYDAAMENYRAAFSFAQDALSGASILTNILVCAQAAKQEDEAQEYFQVAKNMLEKISMDTSPDNRHLLATIYSSLAKRSYKQESGLCGKYYGIAQELWPESNVISNNIAIALSKDYTKDAQGLLKAEGILEVLCQEAEKYNLFVSPYYSADVNIQLASFYKKENKLEEGEKCLNLAKKRLIQAETALTKNLNYQENYKNKSFARLLLLQSRVLLLEGKLDEMAILQKDSEKMREKVVESPEKFIKFTQKFFQPNDKRLEIEDQAKFVRAASIHLIK